MFELEQLVSKVRTMQAAGDRVGLCHGCFDLLHYGHLLHLSEAASLVDRLVVTVTADEFVAKGPGRPVFSAPQRAAMLGALRLVEGVAVCHAWTAVTAIRAIRPDVYVKGRDYRSNRDHAGLTAEAEAVAGVDGEMHFTNSAKWSSTSLLPLLEVQT